MSARFMISSGEPPAASMSFHRELLMVTSVNLRMCSTGLDTFHIASESLHWNTVALTLSCS